MFPVSERARHRAPRKIGRACATQLSVDLPVHLTRLNRRIPGLAKRRLGVETGEKITERVRVDGRANDRVKESHKSSFA